MESDDVVLVYSGLRWVSISLKTLRHWLNTCIEKKEILLFHIGAEGYDDQRHALTSPTLFGLEAGARPMWQLYEGA